MLDISGQLLPELRGWLRTLAPVNLLTPHEQPRTHRRHTGGAQTGLIHQGHSSTTQGDIFGFGLLEAGQQRPDVPTSVTPTSSFVFQALMSLFVLASKDGWVNIMYNGLDAVAVDQQVGMAWATADEDAGRDLKSPLALGLLEPARLDLELEEVRRVSGDE